MIEGTLLHEPMTRTTLHFAAGLPGFPNAHEFAVTTWGGDESPFLLMSSVEDPNIGFVLISPFVFYPDYEFDLDGATEARLGIGSLDEVLVLCIVTLGDRPDDATVNLLGPIVVNTRTMEACQSVLAHSVYDVKAPLSRAS